MRHRILLALLISVAGGCEKSVDSIIDNQGSAPLLLNGNLTPAALNTDTIDVGTERKPDDVLALRVVGTIHVDHPEGPKQISRVAYSLSNEDRSKRLSEGILQDNGLPPDFASRDSIYSGYIDFTIVRSDIGTYHVDLWATDLQGFQSNTLRLPLRIVRLNQPPQLSNFQAPDTVRLGTLDQFILLQIQAIDPDGNADIRRVTFNSFQPDGSPSSGNPFQMYDDGSESVIVQPDIRSGDLKKGDGVYSLRIILPQNTLTGTYRFEFQAVDRSGELSNVLIHMLTVRQ